MKQSESRRSQGGEFDDVTQTLLAPRVKGKEGHIISIGPIESIE
jgi:hypothetical protein